MRIALAADPTGFRYTTILARHLAQAGHEIVDFGTASAASVDYPDFVHPAAAAVAAGQRERGTTGCSERSAARPAAELAGTVGGS